MATDSSLAKDTNGWTPPKLKMVQKIGILEVSNNASTFNYEDEFLYKKYIRQLDLEVAYPSGIVKTFYSDKTSNGEIDNVDKNFFINLNQSGEYKLTLKLSWGNVSYVSGNVSISNCNCSAYIYVGLENSGLKPYTLGDTIRRVLNLTPTRTIDEKPKYTFDPVQLAEYDKEESPEFAFTGHTLFEALLIIAQYKGAFPVLRDGVISFRKLWSGKRYSESELPPPIDVISSSDINQYCTYLDTEVQNLVGINDSLSGAIVEPYAGGYKTTRAVNGSEISQDTAVISTDYNQYLHVKEEIGYIKDAVPSNNDLTSYIYESGDYKALSDMTGAYPNSKAYALQWEQMGKNITELAHRTNSNSNLAQAFKAPAIANIIQAKTGQPYETSDTNFVTYLISLLNPEDKADSFADLMFRTTYIPVLNSRIKQYKEYFGDFHHDGSLKYNQTAELVDSELYGEHLKQLIRKLGNATKRKIYIFDKIDDVPKVGDLIGQYSVYDVQMSIRENKVIATISLVKYAELSRYIGVKNAWKDSDVSTDKCYNRQISHNEFLLFTHDESKSSTSDTLNEIGLEFLVPGSHSELINTLPLTCVEGTGYMADGTKLNTVLLPVVSLAVGNSIMFQWGYQNNYSAGYMSEEAPSKATGVVSGTKYNRAQKAVKYTDMYGKMETYDFTLMPAGPQLIENLIWLTGIDSDWVPKLIPYNGTVTFTDTGDWLTVNLDSVKPVDVNVRFSFKRNSEETETREVSIKAGTASKNTGIAYQLVKDIELVSATCYNINNTPYTDKKDIARLIGHSLPLKPYQLRITTDLSEWKGAKVISCKKLLVQKNSSEALTFSVQLHYCADNENFIIGSGLTNFCPLIGGTIKETALYGFNERINIFDRRISVKSAVLLPLPEIRTQDGKISFKLPADINHYQAWAYVGKDKNENYQIIFGENRDLNGSDFKTGLYLLPMHKLEDFI